MKRPTIAHGSRGPAVSELQGILKLKQDGVFGSDVDYAVRVFQADRRLTVDGVVGPKTWSALLAQPIASPGDGLTADEVLNHAGQIGYKIWEDPWVMFLFGIRSRRRSANSFDDVLGCVWSDGDKSHIETWIGTTDPGSYWLLNPSRAEGTAILVPGQASVWIIDKHQGKYDALCQRLGEVRVYRDKSRDKKLDLDPSTIQRGMFGINIHAASQVGNGVSTAVEKWSAGCQVHATKRGFDRMMELARLQVELTGKRSFTYTLFDEWRSGF